LRRPLFVQQWSDMSHWRALFRLVAAIAVVGLLAGTTASPLRAAAATFAIADMNASEMDCCDPAPDLFGCEISKACAFAGLCNALLAPRAGEWRQALAAAIDQTTWRAVAVLAKGIVPPPLGHPPKA
jgi:hypothetical protein